MTHIMSDGFHAGDAFQSMTWFMGYDWLIVCVSRSRDEIRVGITLVFFPLLHGCYEGFPL